MDAHDTPLMRQYQEIKRQFKDAILLFRLGDFYEMFFEDAEVASKVLEITLTSRDKNAENPIPLCGVPHHSVTGYISKLLEHGFKVAICEQMEDPSLTKGIVKREVVRVISPGLQTDAEGLAATESNPLVALAADRDGVSLAWIEAASGGFGVSHFPSLQAAEDEIWRLAPREVVFFDGAAGAPFEAWAAAYGAARSGVRFERVPEWLSGQAERRLCERFQVSSVAGFGLEEDSSVAAAAAVVYHVETSSRTALPHLLPPRVHSPDRFVHLDRATRDHLEIDKARGEPASAKTLFECLNETTTSMGARRLRLWLHLPLRDKAPIEARLDAVEELSTGGEMRERIRKEFAHVYDLERLIGRIAGSRANARDLLALRSTLLRIHAVRADLEHAGAPALREIRTRLDPHKELSDRLSRALADDPPLSTKEGGMIREGFDPALDDLRNLSGGGKRWVAELEKKERERTGISSLKVGYNRVFGYYIEVTNANLPKVPADYSRKQTLTNAERFVTPELKSQEEKILAAEEKISGLEATLFEELRAAVAEHTRSIQNLAEALSELDVFCSFARVAARYRYTRPTLNDGDAISIRAGRHPVVERFMGTEPFVPNDINLDCGARQLVILTGPNMAGKSTIMRQVALIVLLAQTGSFVPADAAEIGLVDRIFTRVGASDDLTGGRSTFMVEMNETANILRNATRRSLILLDEIGRGTSTFDGLAIAWSVAEFIHDRVGAKTIFATHYHELTDLARIKDRVRNLNVSVREWGDRIVFLRTLAEGAVDRSYGIEVARLAGVPSEVIARSRVILANLETGELDALGKPALSADSSADAKRAQLELFKRLGDELLTELQKTPVDDLAPKDALDLLYRWKTRFG